MYEGDGAATVVILGSEGCRLGPSLDINVTITFIAVASEDPDSWDDIISYWPLGSRVVGCLQRGDQKAQC